MTDWILPRVVTAINCRRRTSSKRLHPTFVPEELGGAALSGERYGRGPTASPARVWPRTYHRRRSHNGYVCAQAMSAQRSRHLLLHAVALATLGFASTVFGPADTIVTARPSPSPADKPSCAYTLSLPQLVEVSGANMVTATVTPYPCTGSIVPTRQVVCINAEGSSGAGQCASRPAESTAQVYFTPYVPGATYISSGKGCGVELAGTAGGPQSAVCVGLGPYSAVL